MKRLPCRQYICSSKELMETRWATKRIKEILEFVGDNIKYPVLDIAERSFVTEKLETKYNVDIENTEDNLDYEWQSGLLQQNYKTIFCFEVLEHLINPGVCLDQIYKALANNGILFISVPNHKPKFLTRKTHFHEFIYNDIVNLIQYCGFEIIDSKRILIFPLWRYFNFYYGIKPIFKLIFDRIYLFKCRKKNG